jgi:ZIP family zinc transporter
MIAFHFIIKIVPEPNPATFISSPITPLSKEDLYSEEDIKQRSVLDPKLLLTGMVVATGIALHNFPEGMAVYMSTMKQYKLGFAVAMAIGLHNIPEGIAVAVSMYAATRSKWDALKWSFVSGLCEPVGAIVFGLLFYGWVSEIAVFCMLGAVAGLMVYICIFELISAALRYAGVGMTILANIGGMVTLFLSSLALAQFEA